MRRQRIILLLVALLLAPLDRGMRRSAKPNIILVMPDDVGYGDYAASAIPSCARRRWMRSRKQSLLFTQFHVSPTCSPCRAALDERAARVQERRHPHHSRTRADEPEDLHPGADAQVRRLHHRHFRQVAPRRRGSLSAGEPRLRRSLYPRRRRHRSDLSRLLRRRARQHEH